MSQKLRVNIVGIGPGNPDLLTGEARQAIASSNILIGDKRMLAAFADSSKTVYDTIKTAAIAEIAAQAQPDKDVLAVLVSGDVGFFSLAKTSAVSCRIVNVSATVASAAWCIFPLSCSCPGMTPKSSACTDAHKTW